MKASLFVVIALIVGINSAPAQGPTPAQPTPPKPAAVPSTPKPAPKPGPVLTPPQLENIRIDITVMEEGGAADPVRKVASVITGDQRPAAVRSQGETGRPTDNPDPRFQSRMATYMRADIIPWIERDGRIRTQVTLEYQSPTSQVDGRGMILKFEPLLDSGKPLRVSEATDPTSSRKVVIEVTATILK